MAWIRLSDTYDEDPKIEVLSDGAFRLWHQVLAYCRRYQTDGLIPKAKMLDRTAYRSKRLDELMSVGPEQAPWTPLVSKVDGFGFKLNAYLKWNPSKDEENERREGSRHRMQLSRERRVTPGVAPPVAPSVARNVARNVAPVTFAPAVPVRRGTDPSVVVSEKEKGDELFDRAVRLAQELYPSWFHECRGGWLTLGRSPKEIDAAVELCKLWPDERLRQMAEVVLTTDDPWISSTDRGLMVFFKKATWADDRLRQVGVE